MALPIELRTERKQLLELAKVPLLGYLGLFVLAVVPGALPLMALSPLIEAASHRPFTEDHAIAFGLLVGVPWNLALTRFDVRVRVLWMPAWVFCLLLGCFGLAKAYGLVS